MSVKIHLAPMAGITDSAMRVITMRHGADVCYTEMVSAAGIANDSRRTFQLFEKLPEEGSVIAHIYGANPDYMQKTAEVITELGCFSGIDINGGCPVHKVTRSGSGAALMRDPKLVEKLVAATVKGTNLPVSFKTRIGLHPGEITIDDVARAVEAGGASQLTVHGRVASKEHHGDVDFVLLRRAVELVSIRVVVNGGIRSPQDAKRMLEETGAKEIMLGQGAMGNPWLFKRISEYVNNGIELPPPSNEELMLVLAEHFQLAMQFQQQIRDNYPEELWPTGDPEQSAVSCFKRFMFHYFRGMRGVTDLRRQMNEYKTISDVMTAISQYMHIN